ncbi:WXG100 family type VII secretion target [Bacillaceae bacterium Marseille-Q3522]|nr:WXG100 family type VII secretion target [Bacillaceae bacterium Marseille-Q3522]
MDTSKVIALAKKYNAAADEVKESELRLRHFIMMQADTWMGKTRERFDADFDETLIAYERFSRDLLETGSELMAAAEKIEREKEEIARMEELARKSN